MKFTDFGLHERVQANVQAAGFELPSPVQVQVVPPLLQGRDVKASAKTGTGKTAAFVLPMLHRLLTGALPGQGIQVLVLSPTRELALQIEAAVKQFARGLHIRAGVVVGGVGYGGQLKMLKGNPQILVATPGRLLDHLGTRSVDLGGVGMVVLDEADRMLDMGFLKPVQKILAEVGGRGGNASRPQMALLTATDTKAVEAFSKNVLTNPVTVALAPARHEHAQITQSAYRADGQKHKLDMLNQLLKEGGEGQAIVFHATKHGADKLAKSLGAMGYAAAALHGGMKQGARKRTLDDLHKNRLRVLVATDVAARGIDVQDLGLVVNFDMPQVAEDYVHRIGRTGRAGASGKAVSLVQFEDMPMVRGIEKILGKPMRLLSMEGLEPAMAWEEFLEKGENAPKSRRGRTGRGGAAAPARQVVAAGSAKKPPTAGKPRFGNAKGASDYAGKSDGAQGDKRRTFGRSHGGAKARAGGQRAGGRRSFAR